jgi:porin
MNTTLAAALLSASLFAAALTALAADPNPTNSAPKDLILNNGLGQIVKVPTNTVPANLLPPPSIGVENQIPQPTRGAQILEPVLQREQEARQKQTGLELFPAAQPSLMPYLGGADEFGNTAIRPGALIATTPWDSLAQGAKYWLSQYGLRYSLQQTATFVGMSGVKQGDDALAFYALSFPAKWAIFSTAEGSTAGWISSQMGIKSGLDGAGSTQSAQSNLGTLTDPSGIWSGVNGIRVQELAWQQSLFDGHLVAVAGVVNQGNYFDANTYANSGRGQYFNSALINSMVMPLPAYNFGANLQWQPLPDWYGMFGGSVGQARAGYVPWTDFTWHNWSLLGEIGFAPKDVLGLGPGVYRIQPFVAQVSRVAQTTYTVTVPGTTNSTSVTVNYPANSPVQAGLCFNFQQQLGQDAPFGWFGRFGFGGSQVTAGAAAQVGTGFGMRGPLAYAGLFPSRKNDTAGIGFVWSQPSWSSSAPAWHNEYVLEAGYVFQLSPFARLQPDLQVIWNPANNPNANQALVFQLQFEVAW